MVTKTPQEIADILKAKGMTELTDEDLDRVSAGALEFDNAIVIPGTENAKGVDPAIATHTQVWVTSVSRK